MSRSLVGGIVGIVGGVLCVFALSAPVDANYSSTVTVPMHVSIEVPGVESDLPVASEVVPAPSAERSASDAPPAKEQLSASSTSEQPASTPSTTPPASSSPDQTTEAPASTDVKEGDSDVVVTP
jgi:hypothetical protein